MPEGDTIHRLARRLSNALVDGRVSKLWLREQGEVAGLRAARVNEVSALGKHLLIALLPEDKSERADEWVLHTHLGMPGRWQRRGEGAAWRQREPPAVELWPRDAPHARGWVCTKPARCELFPRFALRSHPELVSLGPDLLAPPVSYAALLRRARRSPAATIAELLLDQRVACGLGNVYKCELLFLHECDPWSRTTDVSDEEVESLYRHGAELLAANLGPGRRRTRAVDVGSGDRGPRLWVYDRVGLPCLRCATPIHVDRVGEGARVTYWCPSCQPQRALRRPRARGTPMARAPREIEAE